MHYTAEAHSHVVAAQLERNVCDLNHFLQNLRQRFTRTTARSCDIYGAHCQRRITLPKSERVSATQRKAAMRIGRTLGRSAVLFVAT